MRTIHVLATALVVATILLGRGGDARANPKLIKSNVVIVRPQYHQKTSQAFSDWARTLAALADELQRQDAKRAPFAQALRALARHYEGLATAPGHGSGWLWIPPGRDVAFVITNRHVAGQAGTVAIEFDNLRHPSITATKIVYVDAFHDMAVIEVPLKELPPEAHGFEIVDGALTEGNPVWAAGFPGTDTAGGRIAAYSLTNGIVSNAEYPGPEGVAIAHTATIDPGNSGGPLLTEVPTAKLGFRVSGMNTWKANTRTNVNLALPAATIEKVLRLAQESRLTARDPARLTQALRSAAGRLADELGSSRPDYQLLRGMIAYSFVAERPEIMGYLIERLVTGQMPEDEVAQFLDSPVEYARATLWLAFVSTFSTGGTSVGDVRLDRITDEERISTDRPVRTVFRVAGKQQEIVWVWEHGAWRVADASFEHALKAPAADPGGARVDGPAGPEPAEVAKRARRAAPSRWDPGVAIGARLGLGSRGASGENFGGELGSSSSTAIGIDVAFPVSEHLWLTLGAAYNPLGTEYQVRAGDTLVRIHEDVTYLQIPASLRLELPLVGASATTRVFGRAGLAIDVAIEQGGTFRVGGATGSLADPELGWYDRQSGFNVAALLGGGVEVGFGAAPSVFVGLDVTSERHLLREWSDDFFTGGANYRYEATRVGVTLRYQARR